MAAKRPVLTEFGTPSYPDPKKSFFSKMLSVCLPLELSDNNTGSLFQLGRQIFATSETCYFRQIEPSSLSTGEKYDSNKCFGLNIDSAHPITDETGTMWNMGSTFITGLKYNVLKIPPSASNQSAKDLMKKSKIVTSIPSSWNGMMSYNHQSFVVTKNFLIFIEQVRTFQKLVKILKNGNISTISQNPNK
jgi:carotenoid cleavage dioxygenase-like enzyme